MHVLYTLPPQMIYKNIRIHNIAFVVVVVLANLSLFKFCLKNFCGIYLHSEPHINNMFMR